MSTRCHNTMIPDAERNYSAMKLAKNDLGQLESFVCREFGKLLRASFQPDAAADPIVLRFDKPHSSSVDTATTYIDICMVYPNLSGFDELGWNDTDAQGLEARHFVHRDKDLSQEEMNTTVVVGTTVTLAFPCPLSRQRSMVTREFIGTK